MPREVVVLEGPSFGLREYELPALGPQEVRVRTEFAAPKHGTEMHGISGAAFQRKRWDSELRLFLPSTETSPAPSGTRKVGNIAVGTVSAVGPEVTRHAPGDRVFGYASIREEQQAPEARWRPLGPLTEEQAVCSDPAHVALIGVRDGNIRIGDTVAVFGLGAIGLMAVQVARASGARQVFGVDLIPMRRAYAEAHGADQAFDPRACDVALEIKRATGNKGVDVALEVSGSSRALHEAIRCVRQCGTVVQVAWGPKDCSGLHLDQEFHLNRPTLIASQAVWSNPDRSYPLWTEERARQTAIDLLRDGVITARGMLTPVVSFEEAPRALAAIFENPESSIKLGVTFPA